MNTKLFAVNHEINDEFDIADYVRHERKTLAFQIY